MKNITKILPLILFIILISAFASAEMLIQTYEVDYGFMMMTTPVNSYELCSCESYTDYFIVENTGSYASTYDITLDSDYATLSATEFELLPDQSMTVYIFIQGPCDKKVSEDIVVSVSDLFRNTQELVKHLEVGKCQNLEAELRTENNGTSNPCTPIDYEITVTNTGVFTESYHVEFGANKYDEYFNLPYQDMIIEAGASGIVSATFTPECSLSGDVIVPFTIEAENNALIAELNHELNILDNYDFEIIAGEAEVCTLQETQVPILINNKANFENAYSIELDAPKYFSLNTEELNVSGEGAEVFFIIVNPEQKHAGEQNVTLTVTEETDGRVAEIEVSINVVECNDVSVNIDLQEDIYDCAGQYGYPVIVKNTGLVSADVRLDVYGSEYITATESNFALEAGEERQTNIYANLPPAHAMEADIEIVATVLGVEGITAEDTIHVKYLDEQACFALALADKKAKMNFDEEEVSITLAHVGLERASYDLEYEGEGFALMDDDERLSPGEEVELALEKTNESEQRVFKGTLKAFTSSEDDERTLMYNLPVTINYHKESILEKGRDYFVAQPCQFVSVVLLLLFAIGLLIVIVRPDRPRRSGITLLMILLAVWLIIAIVFVAIFGVPQLYEPVRESEDPLVIVMGEDETQVLDLQGFFIDEDGDALDYLVSEMDNVSVDISNGTAYIAPEGDFFGSRRFRITAFDGNGGATESPRMKLEVVDRPEYSGWSWYKHFCGYINVALLLLVFFIVSILFKRRIRPAKEKVVEKKESKPKKAKPKKPAKVVVKKKTAKKKASPKKPKKKSAVKKKKATKKTTSKTAKKKSKKK